MKKVMFFDFGSVPSKNGYLKSDAVYSSPRHLWINRVNSVWRDTKEETPLKDFVTAQKGEFRIGLTKGKYILKFLFFDSDCSYLPFELLIRNAEPTKLITNNDSIVADVFVFVPMNEIIIKKIEIDHIGGPLAMQFIADEGNKFIINALEIYGSADSEILKMFPDAPSDYLPTLKELNSKADQRPEDSLKEICEWLIKNKQGDGFIGDVTNYGADDRKFWYTASYPIRTLLAAYDIFDKQKYLDIAADLLDLFVSEQMPEGGFAQVFRNQPTSTLTYEDIENMKSNTWMNIADVGSMVAALAYACYYVQGTRKTKYMNAVRNYCDKWALRFQDENGGFYNGWIGGKYAQNLYSVATATSALAFSFFGKVSGEKKYFDVAKKAIQFMLNNWNDDGRMQDWPFDGSYPNKPHYSSAISFGDGIYILEGIIASVLSDDMVLRKNVFEIIKKYLFGTSGLFAAKKEDAWWPIQSIWHNTKSAAILIILKYFLKEGKTFNVSAEQMDVVQNQYIISKKFLCNREYSRLLSVMVDDPDLEWGPHRLQSWTGCSISGTGFAGIAIADMIKPGIALLDL